MQELRKRYKSTIERSWYQDVVEKKAPGEYSHLLFPHLGVDGLRPGRKVSCHYGQDTVRRVLWSVAYDVRLPAMTEVIPACGEEDCCAPRHSRTISRSSAQYGRSRGLTIAGLLASMSASVRPEGVAPAWSKNWPVENWGDLLSGVGQTVGLMVWKIAKAEMTTSKPQKSHGPWIANYLEGMPYYSFDAEKLIGNNPVDLYGVFRMLRGNAPEVAGQYEDAFMAIPRSPWFINKLAEVNRRNETFHERMVREYSCTTIGLFFEEGGEYDGMDFPIMSGGEAEELRTERVDLPEPE